MRLCAGCPVVSSHFSPSLAPQVGQRTACTCLTVGFLAFMVIDGAANSHIRVGISCTETHRIEIVDARQTPQAARPKLHSAAASEVLAQNKTATAKIANPSSHIRSRRRGWIGSRCAGCRTGVCASRGSAVGEYGKLGARLSRVRLPTPQLACGSEVRLKVRLFRFALSGFCTIPRAFEVIDNWRG